MAGEALVSHHWHPTSRLSGCDSFKTSIGRPNSNLQRTSHQPYSSNSAREGSLSSGIFPNIDTFSSLSLSPMPHAVAMPSTGLKALVLCGPGSSFPTFTSNPDENPKALLPIANRPMVWYPIDFCYRMGITGEQPPPSCDVKEDNISLLLRASQHRVLFNVRCWASEVFTATDKDQY